MIIIAGTFSVKPDKVDEAIGAMQEMATASQQEEGCVQYQFYRDMVESNQFFLYEEWESAEALAAHSETPHMAVLQSQIPQFVTAPPAIQRYEVVKA